MFTKNLLMAFYSVTTVLFNPALNALYRLLNVGLCVSYWLCTIVFFRLHYLWTFSLNKQFCDVFLTNVVDSKSFYLNHFYLAKTFAYVEYALTMFLRHWSLYDILIYGKLSFQTHTRKWQKRNRLLLVSHLFDLGIWFSQHLPTLFRRNFLMNKQWWWLQKTTSPDQK